MFGYIPPDQDFNPEHPNTRTESMRYRAAVFNWVRANVGIVGTEDGADWTIPYIDMYTGRMSATPAAATTRLRRALSRCRSMTSCITTRWSPRAAGTCGVGFSHPRRPGKGRCADRRRTGEAQAAFTSGSACSK